MSFPSTHLGSTNLPISRIGLGGMHLSIQNRPDEAQAIAVIHRALDLGVTLIDTADSYCLTETDKHHNERLIARALAAYGQPTDHIVVATKGGLIRPQGNWEVDANPQRLDRAIRESFKALGGTRPITLWQLHAIDQRYALCDVFKPIQAAVREGLIAHVGVSNFNVAQIQEAQTYVPIVSVQNRYNPWDRSVERDGVLDYCAQQRLTFFPWSPLGGRRQAKMLDTIPAVAQLAQEKRATPAQVVLAWLMAKAPCIVPIPGPTKIATLEEDVGAVQVQLTPDDLHRLDRAFPG